MKGARDPYGTALELALRYAEAISPCLPHRVGVVRPLWTACQNRDPRRTKHQGVTTANPIGNPQQSSFWFGHHDGDALVPLGDRDERGCASFIGQLLQGWLCNSAKLRLKSRGHHQEPCA
jgi:hypothetical protein